MGLLLKAGALLVGLLCLNVFLWPVSLLCFGYLAYSLWSATRARRIYVMDRTGGPSQAPQPRRDGPFRKRYVLAGVCFILSFVAYDAGGTLSPFAFAGLGAIIVLSGLLHVGPRSTGLKPVANSILLRGSSDPFLYVSLVEVKFGTAQMARALSSVGSEMMMDVSSEKVSVYLPVRVHALSMHKAEAKVAEKLGPVARSLSARSAYVLPLESGEAAQRLGWRLKAQDLALEYHRDGVVSIKSTPFDVLVLSPEGHLIRSAAAYTRRPLGKERSVQLPSAGKRLASQPMLWDALEALQEKVAVPPPDSLTTFLSGVCATQGEPLGDRLVNEGNGEKGTMLVGSMGAPGVQLTRPQLRAIVSAYA
ncbi:MAG: hypothetical protein OK456_08500 [Thaumarchaeota archaeon]|nr:hypothetical protein [Nitrososphaerota archaeon]